MNTRQHQPLPTPREHHVRVVCVSFERGHTSHPPDLCTFSTHRGPFLYSPCPVDPTTHLLRLLSSLPPQSQATSESSKPVVGEACLVHPRAGRPRRRRPRTCMCSSHLSRDRRSESIREKQAWDCPAWSFLVVMSQLTQPGDQDRGTTFLSSTAKELRRRGAARPAGSPAKGVPRVRGLGWWRAALLFAPPRVCARISKSSATVSMHTTLTHDACGNTCSLHYGQGIGQSKNGSMARSIHRT